MRPMWCFVRPHRFVKFAYVLRYASRLSRTPHFGGCAPQWGVWPQIQTRPRFCAMHLPPKFHHPMFTRSEVIVLTNKHTDRRRRKHPTFFTTLRRWVIKLWWVTYSEMRLIVCLFSRLAAVDGSGVMTLYNIDTLSGQDTSAESKLERKDVWSVKWAEVWSSHPCSFSNRGTINFIFFSYWSGHVWSAMFCTVSTREVCVDKMFVIFVHVAGKINKYNKILTVEKYDLLWCFIELYLINYIYVNIIIIWASCL